MKKIGFLTLLIMATLLLTLALPVGAAGPKAAPAPVAAAPAPAAPAAMPPSPYPEIDLALQAMRDARAHLDNANHNFQDHRRKAIEHLNAAIEEAKICQQLP
jgi:hypothetical protein